MSDALTEEEQMAVKGMMGDKIAEEMQKTLKMVEEKNKTAEAKYNLTQQKLDTIIDYLKRIEGKINDND